MRAREVAKTARYSITQAVEGKTGPTSEVEFCPVTRKLVRRPIMLY